MCTFASSKSSRASLTTSKRSRDLFRNTFLINGIDLSLVQPINGCLVVVPHEKQDNHLIMLASNQRCVAYPVSIKYNDLKKSAQKAGQCRMRLDSRHPSKPGKLRFLTKIVREVFCFAKEGSQIFLSQKLRLWSFLPSKFPTKSRKAFAKPRVNRFQQRLHWVSIGIPASVDR